MKKIALIAMTAAAAIATPAMAEVKGTIVINGSVAGKCYVGNTPETKTFGTTVDLKELAKADGMLENSETLTARFNETGGSLLSAKVVCNGAAPHVTVTAGALKNNVLGDAPKPAGYSDTVNYTADVTFTLNNGPVIVSDVTDGSGTSQPLSSVFSTTVEKNVSVATKGWNASGVLIAGAYQGNIIIDVKPAA